MSAKFHEIEEPKVSVRYYVEFQSSDGSWHTIIDPYRDAAHRGFYTEQEAREELAKSPDHRRIVKETSTREIIV
jgi:hypothetical protein